MRETFHAGEQGLTDYDLFVFRKFCEDELKRYLPPMRDFWEKRDSYIEREPGEHPLPDSRFAGETGYRIEKRKVRLGAVRGIAAYPFVRTRALKVIPSDGSARHVLRSALDDPLMVGEFYCVLDGDKRIAFLDGRSYAASACRNRLEACVVLGREEAYAILAGEAPARTRRKIMSAFDMEDGEWLGGSEL